MTDVRDETDLVTIRKYVTASEAHLARGHLEAEGIDAVVTDEHLIDYNMFYGRTMGGIRLLIRAEDSERAAAILEPSVDPEALTKKDLCRVCGSARVRHGLAPGNPLIQILLFVLILATGFLVILFLRWRWRCDDCGHSWRDAPSPAGDDS